MIMCIYVERLRNGDVDQMLYKHYGRLCKHGKTSRDAWKDNMSRIADAHPGSPLPRRS